MREQSDHDTADLNRRQQTEDSVHAFYSLVVLALMRGVAGIRTEFRGVENLPKSGPYILASKHQSEADGIAMADILAQLGIPQDGLVVAGFDRPNIRYHVRPRDGISAQL